MAGRVVGVARHWWLVYETVEMKFAGTILETHPDGVTLAVEVRVEAEDGDAARPVADPVMAALAARPLPPAVTRRVVPVAMVKDETADDYGWTGRTGEIWREVHRFGEAGADDDGMRRDSRE